jgi:hypothetical protein
MTDDDQGEDADGIPDSDPPARRRRAGGRGALPHGFGCYSVMWGNSRTAARPLVGERTSGRENRHLSVLITNHHRLNITVGRSWRSGV